MKLIVNFTESFLAGLIFKIGCLKLFSKEPAFRYHEACSQLLLATFLNSGFSFVKVRGPSV